MQSKFTIRYFNLINLRTNSCILENQLPNYCKLIPSSEHSILQLEKGILQILNKFNTEEDFHKLLKSIRDVKLMDNKLFWKNNLGTGIDVNELKLMENQESLMS